MLQNENNNKRIEKIKELYTQLKYLEMSKKDPINYPPLKYNSVDEYCRYMDFLIKNKDKILPLTPEQIEQIKDIVKDMDYEPLENESDLNENFRRK